ncbi:MAG TPA: VanZ family protein [Crocinitomicaceae bacterium]|nr:VanZ family protein [Crocinitomicaceae bacterium]
MKNYKQAIRIIFALYLITVFVVHVMKTGGVVDLNSYFLGIRRDHWVHGILFSPMGFLALLVLEKHKFWAIFITIFCCCFFETLQYFIPYRSFDIWDIVADTCGASIGILGYLVFTKTK